MRRDKLKTRWYIHQSALAWTDEFENILSFATKAAQ